MYKITSSLIMMVLCLGLAFAYSLSTFSNGFSTEDLLFNGSENKTRYLMLPDYGNITQATFTITGSPRVDLFGGFIRDNTSLGYSTELGIEFADGKMFTTWDVLYDKLFIYNGTTFQNPQIASMSALSENVKDIAYLDPYLYALDTNPSLAGTVRIYLGNYSYGNFPATLDYYGALDFSAYCDPDDCVSIASNTTHLFILNRDEQEIYVFNHSPTVFYHVNTINLPTDALTNNAHKGIAVDPNASIVYITRYMQSGDRQLFALDYNNNTVTNVSINHAVNNSLGNLALYNNELYLITGEQQYIRHLYPLLYSSNPYLEVGTPDGTYEWEHNRLCLNSTEVSISNSLLNDILDSGCVCTGCTFSSSYCYVPFVFHSDTSGNITYLDLDFEYSNNYRINISIYDSATYQLITDNVSVQFKTDTTEETQYTVTGTLTREDMAPETYEITFDTNSTYSRRTYVVTLSNRSTTVLNAYLSKNTSEVTFTISDKYTSEYLSEVLCSMYQFINDSYFPVESHYSDVTGRVKFNYQENIKYRFYFSKPNYEGYIFYLNPILFSTYKVAMTPSLSINYSQDYEGISLIYDPTIFYSGDNNFTFLIHSPDGELTTYGYTLTFPGGTDSQSGSNAIGSQLDSSFTITGEEVGDTVRIDYYYETSLSGYRNFTYFYPIVVSGYNATMMGNRDKTYGLGLFERLFISTIIWVFVLGIATLAGKPIAGLGIVVILMGMFVYIGFIPLWSVIISMILAIMFIGATGEF